METKRIPALVMLLGCSVAAIMSYINHYSLEKMLKTILVALIIFLIIGCVIKVLFDKYIPIVEEASEIDEDGVVREISSDELENEDIESSEGENAEEDNLY